MYYVISLFVSWPSGYIPNLKSLRALSRPLRECSWEGRRYFRLQEDPSCSMYALYHLGVLGHIGFKVHPSIFSDFAQLLARIYEVLKRPSRLSKSPGCTDWSTKSVVFAKICTVATAASTVADMTSAINFVLSKPPANGTRRVSHQPGTLHRETKQWTQRPFSRRGTEQTTVLVEENAPPALALCWREFPSTLYQTGANFFSADVGCRPEGFAVVLS